MERLIGGLGLLVMIALAWALSSGRRSIRPRIIVGGLCLQFGLAFLVLRTVPGQWLFGRFGDLLTELLGFVDEGSSFVFGPNFEDFNFAFRILPVIIFFSALMSILYHYGIMQRLIRLIAIVMQKTLNTSGAESLAAAANIFVGHTEAPLAVRPYLASMTRSELMSLMVGGFATVAGSVMGAYVIMGIDAGHLITASVISAPAALLIAKVMEPERGTPKTRGRVEVEVKKETVNVLHAVANGTVVGVKLAINVGAMLLVFLALIALVNGVIGWLGSWFGQAWSLELILGYLFAPVAWVMGIEWADCMNVGELLGIKVVANEYIAYQEMATWAKDGSVIISERSRTIATYALCGFANFGSIGIQLGGLGPLIPDRQPELAQLGFRAMIGGALAGFMTACVAGMII